MATDNSNLRVFQMIDNYIYFYHLDKFIVIPGQYDNMSDSMSANWSYETPIGRSAPIFSYGGSGPRTLQFNFEMHRDLMSQLNYKNTSLSPALIAEMGSDYVEVIYNYLRASVVPVYDSSNKAISPPVVAIRMGEELFIRGVIDSVGISYKLPILRDGKYAQASINFTVKEIDPYDARTIVKQGGYRGLSRTLERRVYGEIGMAGNTIQYATQIERNQDLNYAVSLASSGRTTSDIINEYNRRGKING